MIEEIKSHKPVGATHYRDGVYYKVFCDQEIYEFVGGEFIYVGNCNDEDSEYCGLENIL